MLPLWWSIMDEQRELWHVKPLREAEEEEQGSDGREEPKKEMAAENLIMVLFRKIHLLLLDSTAHEVKGYHWRC